MNTKESRDLLLETMKLSNEYSARIADPTTPFVEAIQLAVGIEVMISDTIARITGK
jgi:hypothetical protein